MPPGEDRNEVLVLGAGFTKAFQPLSPLMVDDYEGKQLIEMFSQFHHARILLELEMRRNTAGRINLERLWTRLDSLMPYDAELEAGAQLSVLLQELKAKFLQRLHTARQGPGPYDDVLRALAKHCVDSAIDCVTFNYDDMFDEFLWNVNPVYSDTGTPYWHPDGGYGFFCRPSFTCISDVNLIKDRPSMNLLKLHGSANWRVRRGSSVPLGVNDIVHDERWYSPPNMRSGASREIEDHLDREPFMVPPVLTKSKLVTEPILRLIWHWAKDTLSSARKVTFVGYSFPLTDMGAEFLFGEALISSDGIHVVNVASDGGSRKLIDRYREIFPKIRDDQFDFRGAVEWARDFTRGRPNDR